MAVAREEIFGPVVSVLGFRARPRPSRWPKQYSQVKTIWLTIR
jgi:hypothetical protein